MAANSPLSKDKKEIARMFDGIAPKYDLLNHLLSLNIDRVWRRKLLDTLHIKTPKGNVLDLACGTGDISRGLEKRGYYVTGMDLSSKMLEIAEEKSTEYHISYLQGEADRIPFNDSIFDAVTISFGIRNFDKRAECIDEIYRILKSDGTLAILEFGIPRNKVWKSLYSFYFLKILPAIGRVISKKQYPYSYLPASAVEFPQREAFCAELIAGGFKDVKYKSLTGGVAYIYTGKK